MSQTYKMNMRELHRSRKKLKDGDIFVYQMMAEDGFFRFGRVVSTEAKLGGIEKLNLIYLYTATSYDKHDIPKLDCSKLLLPPQGVHNRPWTLGYFENVAFSKLGEEDVLKRHCFRNMLLRGKFLDEYGQEIFDPEEPIGMSLMGSHITLDRAVRLKLGIPTERIPEHE